MILLHLEDGEADQILIHKRCRGRTHSIQLDKRNFAAGTFTYHGFGYKVGRINWSPTRVSE